MISTDTNASLETAGTKASPFGFVGLQDRKPRIVPDVRTEIRDLLAQRGKG